MTLFHSRSAPLWRQTWFRLLLLSGSTVGIVLVTISRLPLQWTLTDPAAAGSTVTAETGAIAAPPAIELRQVDTNGIVRPYIALTQLSYGLTQRVLEKEQAVVSYGQAISLAQQALALRQQGSNLELSQQEEDLWQGAIRQLETITSDSAQHAQAQKKITEYSNIATAVRRRIEQQQSGFLATIAAERGNPKAVRISLCQLGTNECRAFQGNVPPASLASLVKLPIAVALMHQVTQGKANLDEQIYIDPSNFTENAQGAKIFVDKTYTLREVMVRMITESNNLATNQLVDYMG
ncbi:MAG: serine hydrolase, partial [Cyanobacteria bacterium P01_D01_bin.2]